MTIRAFTGYRPNPPAEHEAAGRANGGESPDYEGVVFTDGTVVIRWLTTFRSHSVWASWADFYAVHGHPEYGTRIEWEDCGDEHGPPSRGDTWEKPVIPCGDTGAHEPHDYRSMTVAYHCAGNAADLVSLSGAAPQARPCTENPRHPPHDYKILSFTYRCPGGHDRAGA